ncbi:Annexin D8 [Vitis vinifera]|uniref:Annexin D8 n=1 Tax=Vitis vinifera TaxID=29760 RepID=A0A438FC20_VITVI|nr:Annexin D8 [Vitis vinifera]
MESRSTQASKKYQLDCQYLNSCFSGNDPNNIITKQKLVELLITRSQQELKLIRQTYITLYNKDLLHVLSGIRKNDAFANLVHLRLSEPQDRDADISSILSSRPIDFAIIPMLNRILPSKLKVVFKEVYAYYNPEIESQYGSKVDRSMAMCDAKTLYEAMESGIFVDWKAVISLMSERNTGQLKAILISYKELYGQEFSKFLKCNKCGKFGKELRVVVRGMQYPERFLAKQLNRARQNSNAREVPPTKRHFSCGCLGVSSHSPNRTEEDTVERCCRSNLLILSTCQDATWGNQARNEGTRAINGMYKQLEIVHLSWFFGFISRPKHPRA